MSELGVTSWLTYNGVSTDKQITKKLTKALNRVPGAAQMKVKVNYANFFQLTETKYNTSIFLSKKYEHEKVKSHVTYI